MPRAVTRPREHPGWALPVARTRWRQPLVRSRSTWIRRNEASAPCVASRPPGVANAVLPGGDGPRVRVWRPRDTTVPLLLTAPAASLPSSHEALDALQHRRPAGRRG